MSRFTRWRRPLRLAVALLGTVLLAALVACDSETPAGMAEPGPIDTAPQRPGDPERGYDILVNEGYVTCGLPYEAYAAARGDEVSRQRLPGRRGRNAELPYDLNATVNPEGVELVVTNCLACHAAELDGELVVGLGNAFRDFSTDPRPVIERFGLLVADGAPARAWRRWADRMHTIAPYMITSTLGVNPAPSVTLALMAHRDPRSLAWSEEPRMEVPQGEPLPTKVPPWWRMSKRASLFHHGAGRGDHVPYIMLKSLLCTDDRAEAQRIDEWFTDVRAYLETLQPPRFPYAVDAELARQGQTVFDDACAGCHGTYGEDSTYPNLLIALEDVGTDPVYAEQAVAAQAFVRWFNDSFYGERAQTRPGLGYVAPPLDGVWATAPYLHNASIPSLAALLDSRLRPTYWRHRAGPPQYDAESLGWHHEVLEHGKDGTADEREARRIYDTLRPGHGNQGHTFADALDETERRALLEYLKTL